MKSPNSKPAPATETIRGRSDKPREVQHGPLLLVDASEFHKCPFCGARLPSYRARKSHRLRIHGGTR